jgi:hypothetical protein
LSQWIHKANLTMMQIMRTNNLFSLMRIPQATDKPTRPDLHQIQIFFFTVFLEFL